MSIVSSKFKQRACLFYCTFFLAIFLAPSAAFAERCYTQLALGMNFGSVGPGGGATITEVTVRCDANNNPALPIYYEICIYINPGQWSTIGGPRRLINYQGQSPVYLDYMLYSDPQHSSILDGIAAGGDPAKIMAYVPPGQGGKEFKIPVYGGIIMGQAVRAGRYEEQGVTGLIRYRYDTSQFSASDDCLSGGIGGGVDNSLQSSGITAIYENSCWVVATDLNFGNTPSPTTMIHENSTIRVSCPPGTMWDIGLDNGQNYSGQMRRMRGQNGYIQYQLYRDQNRSSVWGNNKSQNTVNGSTDNNGSPVSITVYGEVMPQPDAAVGNYSDTVIVTLYY